MSFITTSSLVFLAAFLTQNLLTLKLNKIEYKTCSLRQGQVVKNQLFRQFDRRLIVTTVVLSLKLSYQISGHDHINRKYHRSIY